MPTTATPSKTAVTFKSADGLVYTLTAKPIHGATRIDFPNTAAVEKFLANGRLISPQGWLQAFNLLLPPRPGTPKPGRDQALGQLCRAVAEKQILISKAPGGASGSNSGTAKKTNAPAAAPQLTSASSADFAVAPPDSGETPFGPETQQTHVEAAQVGENPAAKAALTETRGCPISMVSGEELLQLVDAQLPGPLPFLWQRTYRTGHSRDTGLGHGWTHSGGERLYEDAQHVEMVDDEGRSLRFKRPLPNQRSTLVNERLDLDCLSFEAYALRQEGQPSKVFYRLGQTGNFRLTQIRHPAYRPASAKESEQGFCIDLFYDERGALVRIAGNWGKSLLLARDERGHLRTLRLHDQASQQSRIVVEYDYDAAGDLIAQRDAAGRGESYHYDNHILRQRRLATGFSYYYEWDRLDNQARCLRTWGDKGIYDYRFTWDPANKRSTATDSRGFTSTFSYNEFGLITEHVDNEGCVHRYDYDKGLRSSYTDAEGNVTRYTYDSSNHLVGEIDPLEQRQTRYYFQGKLVRVTGKDGAVWKRSYNGRGLLESVTGPDGQPTSYQYNKAGLLVRQSDGQKRVTRYEWDPQGQLKTQIDPQGHRQVFQYNAWGQLVQADLWLASRQHGDSTRYHYNGSGELARVQYANGESIDIRYNANGQIERISDRRGRVTRYEYDGLSQIIRKTDPEGNSLRYEYDRERNLVKLTNENGDVYRFVYDGNERLIEEIGFDGRRQVYRYNRAGHLISHRDADAVESRFERDPLGRMLTKSTRSLQDASAAPETSRFLYDATGRLKECYNANQYLTFAYDALGRLIRERHSDINEAREIVQGSTVELNFQREASGQLKGLTLPGGDLIGYRYDPFGRLEQAAFNGEQITRIERDQLGVERSRHQGELLTLSDYDPMGRLLRQQTQHREHKTAIIDRQYDYDPFGNLSLFRDGNWEVRYVYDMLDRLKRSEGALAEHFVFDPANNLLGQQKTAGSKTQQGNRLAMQGDRKFDYDARGNVIQERRGKGGKLLTAFDYNLNNQLVKVIKDGQSAEYKYDPLGRRIEKRDTFGTTRYLWAGDQLAREDRNNIRKTYIYEPESFRPLAMVQDGEVFHYHLDHLGTPRELTNKQGKIVWKVRYQTYGNVALKEVDEVENNLRFQGQYFDEETGLHYNRHRYYNPQTGQFTQQDPIGLLGGMNNYQYAPNPTGWVDPLGLMCSEQKYALTTDMDDEYRGEEFGCAKAWAGLGNSDVDYLVNEAERAPYEVLVKDGRLINQSGAPLDTRSSLNGKYMFVMDPQGRIFAGQQRVMEFHHSSFLAGELVAAAGELMVVQGIVIAHSRRSGHYKPDAEHHAQFKSEMKERGINLDSVHEDSYD